MIYLLRHGETEFNRLGKYQGILDSPLTPLGRAQVSQNSILLKHQLTSSKQLSIYASPLGRAMDSAKIICQHLDYPFDDVIIDERLQEVDLGEWSGHSFSELKQDYPQALAATNQYQWYFQAPNGESYDHVVNRCRNWLKDIDSEKCNIVISHGLLGRILRGVYANLNQDDTLEQAVPQKGFYRLREREISYCTDNYELY
ncbi:histidine phosphatase family protein [uncultured Vagococcus sp.]|uniref:histidine phosphatase family protein n=1 Tax=uncultured Vagococcus sp. TaxID=189676 RepID=UPI0028D26DEF|nr:histidine phosphatase family protein [uncultured Vagococcus sp.]